MNVPKLPISDWIDALVDWIKDSFGFLFSLISGIIEPIVSFFQGFFTVLPPIATIALIALYSWWLARWRVGLFAFIGLLLIYNLGYWKESIETISLVLTSAFLSILIGFPLGLWTGRSQTGHKVVTPILNLLQTIPALVYLIPAIFFFTLGTVPGIVASVIFSMPPTIRMTSLGLRQVSEELREVADAFGATPAQKLWKVEIPVAQPTIMAGINQTILLSLSMVLISAITEAGGLGELVLQSLTQLQVGKGFEVGLAIVIIAVILDRLSKNAAKQSRNKSVQRPKWIRVVAAVSIFIWMIISLIL